MSHYLIILMHGKWSHPNTPLFRILETRLKKKGYIVEKPNMPWSRTRQYDQTYESSLEDLSKVIQQYRKEGVKKVILIGHSLGGNAAIAYQAHVGDADAIVAITPGHNPYYRYTNDPRHMYILKKVEDKLKKNEGKSLIEFTDVNCDRRRNFTKSAEIFFSYFNPIGLGHMPATIKKINKPTPILYIEGVQDHVHNGPEFIFSKVPYHTLSTYILTSGNHMTTPELSGEQIIEWLNFLSK